jgi:hypothetical protein
MVFTKFETIIRTISKGADKINYISRHERIQGNGHSRKETIHARRLNKQKCNGCPVLTLWGSSRRCRPRPWCPCSIWCNRPPAAPDDTPLRRPHHTRKTEAWLLPVFFPSTIYITCYVCALPSDNSNERQSWIGNEIVVSFLLLHACKVLSSQFIDILFPI